MAMPTLFLSTASPPSADRATGQDHGDRAEQGRPRKPAHQAWFCKHANSVNAPFAPSQIPKASPAVNYEIELVLVIGKGGRHITGVDAPRHIFCNCVSNDVTVRDWQFRTSQWALGKSFDTYGPLGPWITTSTSAKPAFRQCLASRPACVFSCAA
jgi:2-keto-4-pentenoate hydratase/2-oxohepta-3-ene-1,7-dioic acid hydratase in catechol pathway